MTTEPRYYANISELQEATDSKAANILLASGWELLSVKERSSTLNGPNGIVRDGEVCYVFGRQSSKVTGATDNVSQQAPVVGASGKAAKVYSISEEGKRIIALMQGGKTAAEAVAIVQAEMAGKADEVAKGSGVSGESVRGSDQEAPRKVTTAAQPTRPEPSTVNRYVCLPDTAKKFKGCGQAIVWGTDKGKAVRLDLDGKPHVCKVK